VVVTGPLKEALDTARAQPIDSRKWTIKQCRDGGRKSSTKGQPSPLRGVPAKGGSDSGSAKGVPNTGLHAKGMPNTGLHAKGVLRAPQTGRAAKGVPKNFSHKKTAAENEEEFKTVLAMLRDSPR
jgi:hypothetical protein